MTKQSIIPHIITPNTKADEGFLFNSWLKSYRMSPHTARWADRDYYPYMHARIEGILARSKVLVARPVDWPDGILSYLVYEQTPTIYYLHYVYTKTTYRKEGLANALLVASNPQGKLTYTHRRPPYSTYASSSHTYQRIYK